MAERPDSRKTPASVIMMAVFALAGIVILLVAYVGKNRSMLYIGLAVTVVAVVEGIVLMIVQGTNEKRRRSPRKP